jgi:PAS domain S-box-containing protein
VFLATPYSLALGASTAVSAAVVVLAWEQRRAPGGAAFAAMMSAVVIWSLGSALETAAVGQALKLQMTKLSYLGSVSTAPLFLLFALGYFHPGRRLPAAAHAFLWAMPAAALALALTAEQHGLIWRSPRPSSLPGSNLLVYGHGPVYWILLAHAFLLVLAGTVVVVRGVIRGQGTSRTSGPIVLAAALLPWVGMVVYLTPLNPWPGLDMPVMAFALTGALLIWGIFTRRLFSLVPVARDLLVEQMADGLIVLDAQDRVQDANPTALRILGARAKVVGRTAAEALASCPAIARAAAQAEESPRDVQVGEGRFYELRTTAVRDAQGELAGRMLHLRDITRRRQAEQDKERLIRELQQALADVKTLHGLLPICASCKKIRNDQGYWQNLEGYICEHSEAEFSHGLCPDCLRRLYPDLSPGQGGAAGPEG